MNENRTRMAAGLIIATVTLLTLAFVWNHIIHFLQAILLPFCRRILGKRIGGLLTDLTVFLDGKACPAREVLRSAWSSFKFHVLGIQQTYQRVDASTVKETTVAHVRRPDNQVAVQTSVRTLDWHDVPPEIREQMARAAEQQIKVNSRDVIRDRMRTRVDEEAIELELEI